ncbi:MAG: hypothetical protein JWL64_2098, partial [Frankiales bacterium]|nr:hypothetical protein [Frankiales bacterium]
IPVAGAALLIGAGVQRNSRSPETALLERPFMQYIGKVSYAWYLWHWPMLMLLPAWLGRPLHTWENLEVVGLAFWFAVLTYFLENAAHRSTWSTRKWAGAGILLSASVALVALVVGALMPNLVGKGGAVRPLALVQADQVLVGNAVRDSLAVRLVPKNLTPTLVTAPKDIPHTPRDDCFASLLMTTSEQCTYGAQDAPASQTAVLVGDSPAAQWLEALALDASEQNWKVIQLTKAACPIADIRTWQQDLGRDYSECTAFRHYVEGEVARIKPALIIGSQANILADGSVTAQRWADSTLAELSTLAGGRSRIAFIGDSTQTRTNTVDCLAAHLDDAASCAYSRSTGIWSIDRYRALAATLSNAGVGYVDTMGFFCAESYCPALVNNMLVHRDEGHITNTYAMWLRPMLNPIFQGASRD